MNTQEFLATLDPELAAAPDAFLPAALVRAVGDDPPLARRIDDEVLAQLAEQLPPTAVTLEERTIPGPDGEIPIVIYQPPNDAPRPGLLWIHGGGYISGRARDDHNGISFAEHAGCTVVSVEYRLAPEATYKEAVADCFGALLWLAEHADELGVDRNRLAVGGASAGGGLSAGLALYNRDQGGPALVLQLLIYPMIDDRHTTPSSHEITFERVWNRAVSQKAWRMYLGEEYGTDRASPYAAAARATDLQHLPPAFVTVGTRDLFRDESIVYAQRLMAAGVPTELAVYPGVYHGAETLVPQAAVSRRMRRDYLDALKRALA
ncbi:MAG: alpha/beta hydrolase [Anaerolineaceae bacterium]|nr:alpha/beta hydrolase [Chloroflexota bacterium]MCY4009856.1 alpha/beta hydrolase [Anaerolineaceae bacterium]